MIQVKELWLVVHERKGISSIGGVEGFIQPPTQSQFQFYAITKYYQVPWESC